MILRRRSFTSSSSQKYAWRSWTHSKYETVTPPEFARMSGTTRMPRSLKISSACGVVGPLAASTIDRRLDRVGVLVRELALERGGDQHVAVELQQLLVGDVLAALVAGERPGLTARARSDPGGTARSGCRRRPGRRRRRRRCSPARRAAGRRAPPTLPKPWTTTRASSTAIPRCFRVASVTYMTPRPVALTRPFDPPMATGLPVTTPGTENPSRVEYVSMIHAMICSSVPCRARGCRARARSAEGSPTRSGASSARARCATATCGSTITPPFAPPYGMFTTAHFHVIHIASAFTSSRVTAGW